MKILILGGTGAMGAHLTRLAGNSGAQVAVTSRSARAPQGNVRYIEGNARDDEFIRGLLGERRDVIVDFMTYSTRAFQSRMDLLLGATDQYIFLSSARVYADSAKSITEESARLLDVSTDKQYLQTDEYALSKARQENLLLKSNRQNWTIIRPYITYSEERLQLWALEKEAWLYRALRRRTIVFSTDISSRLTTLTYGLDVARGLFALIGKQDALGEAFHITASRPIAWGRVLSIYSEALEKHLGKIPKTALLTLTQFEKVHPARYQIYYDRLYNRSFDNTKVARFINVNSFVDPEEGLRQCLNSFLKAPRFLTIDWKMEGRKDRHAKETASIAELNGLKPHIQYYLHRYLAKI